MERQPVSGFHSRNYTLKKIMVATIGWRGAGSVGAGKPLLAGLGAVAVQAPSRRALHHCPIARQLTHFPGKTELADHRVYEIGPPVLTGKHVQYIHLGLLPSMLNPDYAANGKVTLIFIN